MEMNFAPIKIKKIIDTLPYQEKIPKERGKIIKYSTKTKSTFIEEDKFISGCLSRYNHPKYMDLLFYIRNIVEKILDEKVYPTYHFDRFYFKGQDLKKHTDRPSCEISVTLTLNHNANYDWPLFFEVDSKNYTISTDIGDAILYSGITTPHWRLPLEGNHDVFWHQIFLHYVRSDGPHVQNAFEYKNQ